MNRMRQAILKGALAPADLAGDAGSQQFRFDQEFVGFSGHFPGYPILPAILQTLLAQMLAEQVVGRPVEFLGLNKAKFFRQLRPGEKITVQVEIRKAGEELRCLAELAGEGEPAASFTLLLGVGASA